VSTARRLRRLLGDECDMRGFAPRWLRRFWWRHVRGYACELCQDCGGPVGVVWTAPDDLWLAEVGLPPWGVLCVHCFDDRFYAATKGKRLILRWVPRAEDPDDEARAADLSAPCACGHRYEQHAAIERGAGCHRCSCSRFARPGVSAHGVSKESK
jgi:hypothetical protein